MSKKAAPTSSWPVFGLHTLGLASAAYSFRFLTRWETPLSSAFGWYFQDIAVLSVISFAAVCALGAAANLTASKAILRTKNNLALIATPLAVSVCLFSYSTKVINRELTDIPDHVMPIWGHLSLHLVPAVVLTGDFLARNNPPWTVSTIRAYAVHLASMCGYWTWLEMCAAKNGWYYIDWIGKLSYSQRAIFIASWSGLMTASYCVLSARKAK